MGAVVLADHTWWHTYGELTVWFAGVIVAIGVLAKTKPVRWLFRRLFAEPFTEWFRREGGEIIEEKIGKEFASNGGESLRDAIDGLRDGQAELTGWAEGSRSSQEALKEGIATTFAQIGEVQTAVVQISASVGTTLADHGRRISALEGGQADVLEAIGRLHECMERRLGPKSPDGGEEVPT